MSIAQATKRGPVDGSRLRRTRTTGPLMLLGVWVLVAGAVGFTDAALLLPLRVKLIEMSLMLFSVGLILAAIAARPLTLRASLVRLRLGPWFAVGFSIVFGISSLTWLKPQTSSTTLLVVNTNFLVPAGALALFGLVALLAGYRICPRGLARSFARLDAASRGVEPRQPSLLSILALWALSMIARLAQIATGTYGYLSDPSQVPSSSVTEVLALLSSLGLLATLLCGWRYAQSRSISSRLVLGVVLVSQLLLGLFSADKEPFVVQLVAVFVGYGVNRRVRLLPVVASVVVFIFFVSPFVTLYRADVNTVSGRLSPEQVLSDVSLGDVASAAADTSGNNAFDYLVLRLSRVGDVAVIMQKTPSSVPYRSPTELLEAPVVGIIPRSIWAHKPVLDAGNQMSRIYYELPPSIHTSSAVTPYGDLWRHGGLGVVGIGMLLLGFIARVVDARPGDPARDPRLLFLPMLLFVPVVKQETDYGGLLASLVGIFLLAALASRVVTALSAHAGRYGAALAPSQK